MNCTAWQELMIELVRSDAMTRGAANDTTEALDHARQCAACATFLREQRRVTELLAAVRGQADPAEQQESSERMARVELKLLEALRSGSASGTELVPAAAWSLPAMAVETTPPPGVPGVNVTIPAVLTSPAKWHRPLLPTPPQRWRVLGRVLGGALAATILLALVILWQVPQEPQPTAAPQVAIAPPLPTTPTPQQLSRNSPEPARIIASGGNGARAAGRPAAKLGAPEDTVNVCSMCTADGSASSPRDAEGASPQQVASRRAEQSMISREPDSDGRFIPLAPATSGFYQDGPLVMRVRMPMAALESLGMSVSGMSAQPAGLVQADLLVGSDGIMRGIRFVQ